MPSQLKVISGNDPGESRHRTMLFEENVKHFCILSHSALREAQKTWTEIWKELEGSVVDGGTVLPGAEDGFRPLCGWPEFLEKMWVLKHHLDYATKYSESKVYRY